ncbi:MAG: metallophosphoesterase family protein [Chloroflexi bacterium]|nr:metallophosphoesterase family protein [Ardenticatenaceae bacterium]MBL1129640.1 metallophosphoesterase [Chloroflexota bacterium]NOG35720.1 metallophosphoesterase family protein [Chloroflexota bacterium]GIK55960.1 MAG: metallophosphoesterase [Chloroflexota bacterium]
MKVAVISDIHGNLPALETAVADLDKWQPDVVVVDGDIVNRGPCSLACWQLIQARAQQDGWQIVKGNHEAYVLECAHPLNDPHGPSLQIRQYAQWTYDQLNGHIAALAALPDQYSITAPDGRELRAVHASMQDNRTGIYPETADADIEKLIAPPPAIFVTAHTHRPLMRQIGPTLVVNIGAVGAPFDEDKRLSYGRFTWTARHGWQSEIVRLAYNWQQTIRDYVTSGFLEQGGPLAQIMLVEHRKSRGLIYRWASRYESAVRQGELTLEESVHRVLQDEDLRPYLGPPGWDS